MGHSITVYLLRRRNRTGPATAYWLAQFGNDLWCELDPSRAIGCSADTVQATLSTPIGNRGDIYVQDVGCRLGGVTSISTRLIVIAGWAFSTTRGNPMGIANPLYFAGGELAAVAGT